MTLDIKSDLHLDFWVKTNGSPSKEKRNIQTFVKNMLPNNPGDIFILAGDISHYNKQTFLILEELKKCYKHVILVYGNHDLYLTSNSIQEKYHFSAMNRIHELREGCNTLGVYFLDGDIVEINNVTFGGLCGWYDVSSEENYARWLDGSNDARLICPKYRAAFAQRYAKIDKKTPEWNTDDFYEEQLQNLKRIAHQKCDVLISHVPQMVTPTAYMEPEFRDNLSNVFYYVDNMDLIKESSAKVYIHGHVHNTLDYHLSGINIVCSPYGYPHDGNTVQKAKQIQI